MPSRCFNERWAIEQKRLAKMHENLGAQKNAQRARFNKLQKTLQMAEQQVANLKARASMDSVVQEVPLQAGQRVSVGGNIARLARQDQLIAELKIPESQIRDVMPNQPVVIDTRNSIIHGHVSCIAPSVENGSVQVDVELDCGQNRIASLTSGSQSAILLRSTQGVVQST